MALWPKESFTNYLRQPTLALIFKLFTPSLKVSLQKVPPIPIFPGQENLSIEKYMFYNITIKMKE